VVTKHTHYLPILRVKSLTKLVSNSPKNFESKVRPLTIRIRATTMSRVKVTEEVTYKID